MILFHRFFRRNQSVTQSNSLLFCWLLLFLFEVQPGIVGSSAWSRSCICGFFAPRQMGGTGRGILKVAVMSELALDSKPASSILSVGHTHPFTSDLGRFGLHCEGDVLLQGDESLVDLSLEGVCKHAAVRG